MIMSDIILYDYFRSTAAYRVRLALNLKGVEYQTEWVNLVDGDQRSAAYTARNPQGLVPMLHMDGVDLSQSLAILDYLDTRFPEPRLLPPEPFARAKVLADAMVIIADIHPINNLRVWQYLKDPFGHSQDDVVQWMQHWIAKGYAALETSAPDKGVFGGETPNLIDICLTAQMYNAERFGLPMADFPKLARIHATLGQLPAFQASHPDMIAPET